MMVQKQKVKNEIKFIKKKNYYIPWSKIFFVYFKQLPLTSPLILELCYFSFGEILSFAVTRGFVISFENALDFHTIFVSVWPAGIAKELKIGWSIKKFVIHHW